MPETAQTKVVARKSVLACCLYAPTQLTPHVRDASCSHTEYDVYESDAFLLQLGSHGHG